MFEKTNRTYPLDSYAVPVKIHDHKTNHPTMDDGKGQGFNFTWKYLITKKVSS